MSQKFLKIFECVSGHTKLITEAVEAVGGTRIGC